MKYQRPLTKKPLFKLGGSFLDKATDPSTISNIGNSMGSSGSAGSAGTLSDIERFGGGDMLAAKKQTDAIGGGLESAVGSFGPWGAAIAAGSKASGKLFGSDEYGDYKDTTGGTARKMLNNTLNIKEHAAGINQIFQAPSARNIGSFATLGLIKGDRERNAEALKRKVQLGRESETVASNEMIGAQIQNSLPTYQAPAYGKRGMKFKSKFAKGGRIHKQGK